MSHPTNKRSNYIDFYEENFTDDEVYEDESIDSNDERYKYNDYPDEEEEFNISDKYKQNSVDSYNEEEE